MILEQTYDSDLLRNIMTDGDIWERINVDNINKNDFAPVIPSNVILIACIVESVIGIHMFTKHSDKVLYHPMLLKKYRKEHGRTFLAKALNGFLIT